MKVAITGASGFIGLNVAEALLRQGCEILLTSRRSVAPDGGRPGAPPGAWQVLSSLPGQVRCACVDVTDAEALTHAFSAFRPDIVVHGAAMTPGRAHEREHALTAVQVNVTGTMNALEGARRSGAGRFVMLSSAAVYGRTAFRGGTLDESETACDPESIYAVTKSASEGLALRGAALFGMQAVALRIGAAFGPWEWDTGVRDTLSAILQTTRLASRGQQARLSRPGRLDWIYARDVAEATALVAMADSLPRRIYNLGGATAWSAAEWCVRLAHEFDGFSHEIDAAEPNVDFHSEKDQSPLAMTRFEEDFAYRPRFGLAEAFVDYMAWIGATPEFWADGQSLTT